LICQSNLVILNLLNLFFILYMLRSLLPLIFLTIYRWVRLQIHNLIRSSFTDRVNLPEVNNLWFLLIVIVNLILNVLKLTIIVEIRIICDTLNIILILYCRLSQFLSSQLLILINFCIILKFLIIHLLIIFFALKAIYRHYAFLPVTSIILGLRIHFQEFLLIGIKFLITFLLFNCNALFNLIVKSGLLLWWALS